MTEYLIPDTIAEAVRLLSTHAGQARIIAGGTDVLPDLRKGKHAPACLVDITRIPEMTQITIECEAEQENEAEHPEQRAIARSRRMRSGLPGTAASFDYVPHTAAGLRSGCSANVTVGAAVTFAMLREHPYLQAHVHALVEAAASVGAAPIQAAATWGGNLVQAMPAADGAISAIALDAEMCIVDAAGARWLPVLSTFLGPGRSAVDPTRQLITAIRFPIPASPWGTAWRRAGRRPSLILPTLNCAVKLVLNEDSSRITDAAIALGPVSSCPHRATEAEAYLVDQVPGPEAFIEAAHLAQSDADPRSSIHRASREYRLAILPVLVVEALATALARSAREV